MGRSALVLGGGGVTGIAWETGLLAGLAELGIDLAAADVIIGTSAGSVVGTDIASGQQLEVLYQAQLAPPAPEPAARMGWSVIGRLLWVMSTSRDPVRARARIGHWALAVRSMPEADRRKVFEARLPVGDWPARTLKVTAVDARTGELVVFDSAGEAGLVDAVGASCAVPGVWPPVTIGDRRLMDGGVAFGSQRRPGGRRRAGGHRGAGGQRHRPHAQPQPAGRRAGCGRSPRRCSYGRTAQPCAPSGATCLTCRAGRQRRPLAGPRPARQRLRSGQSGGPMAGRSSPSHQACRCQTCCSGYSGRRRQVGPGRCGFPRTDVGG